MELKIFDILKLHEQLSYCTNVGLGPTSFVLYLELRILIEQLILKRGNSLKILMNSYGIQKPVPILDGNGKVHQIKWEYAEHEKVNEIVEKLNAINNQVVKLNPANFIPSEEFHVFTAKLPMDVVLALSKILMKK